MTVLVVVPDYVSHWFPLSAVAAEIRHRGQRVVVATGPGLAARVAADGHEHVELVLGAGRNTGAPAAGPDPALDAFLDATRRGMVATLRHQAERRRHDLMWEPALVADRIGAIVADVMPDAVVADQLAFGATAALRGHRVPYLAFLPGHPCQLPGPDDTFGCPSSFPPVFDAPDGELAALRALCGEVNEAFTASYNETVARLDSGATPLPDAFAAGGTRGTMVNYPASLGGHADRLPAADLLGSCVRSAVPDPIFDRLAREPRVRPRAYVSLGSFLSARGDVLGKLAESLRLLGWDAVVATGATPARALGPLPASWILGEQLPQVAALRACDVVVCHAGNNTVTESLSAGLPVLAAPFSTDQFAGAEDLRRAGLGDAFDPGSASSSEIAGRLVELAEGPAARRAADLGKALRRSPGATRAADLVEAAGTRRLAAARGPLPSGRADAGGAPTMA